MQASSPTGIAFLRHDSPETALSVLVALTFRIASSSDALQTVLCQLYSMESKRNLQAASDLSVSIMSCAGPAYIVIDGLDEIEVSERELLLSHLLLILDRATDIWLFISSRAESDINEKLESKSEILQVDKKNDQGIHAFVQFRTERWFTRQRFYADEQAEIQSRLKNLAPRSAGQ